MRQAISGFLALSLAAHAAAFIAWRPPEPGAPAPAAANLHVTLMAERARADESSMAQQAPAPKAEVSAPRSVRRAARSRPPVAARAVSARKTSPEAAPPARQDTRPSIAVPAGRNITDTGAVPAPSATTDYAAQGSMRIRASVRTALQRYFSYPLLARRKGWEGRVTLRLRVERDGQLSEVRVAHSSGYPILDAAALASARRIPHLSETATWLHGNHFDMVLPVEYRLIDG